MTVKSPATSRDRLKDAISQLFEIENGELSALAEDLQLDKRSTQRKEHVAAEVTYTDNKRSAKGVIIDVGAEGISIDTNCPFAIGQDVILTFPHPSIKKYVKISGRIIRKTPKGIGVRFSKKIPGI
jgi:hypothetical protein